MPAVRIARRATSTHCSSRDSPARCAQTSSTPTSCTPTSTAASPRAARHAARLDEAQRRSVPARSVPFCRAQPRRLADRVITITDALHRFTVERVGVPADKVETIHYGLEGLPAAWGVNGSDDVPRGARIAARGLATDEQKGIDVAMRALPRFPTTRCSSCSATGPSARALERLALELGVEQRVFLLGRVPDVAAWLRRATCSFIRRAGRASASQCSRRCSPGSRWSRRTSARCRSSSSTVRPGCSSHPTIRPRSRAASRRRSTGRGSASRAAARAERVLGRAHGRRTPRSTSASQGEARCGRGDLPRHRPLGYFITNLHAARSSAPSYRSSVRSVQKV